MHTLLGLKNDARYLFVSCPSIVVRFGLKAGPPHVCVLPTDASLAEVITMLGAVSPHAIPSVDDTVVLSGNTRRVWLSFLSHSLSPSPSLFRRQCPHQTASTRA